MEKITMIGLDLAKSVFQVHGVSCAPTAQQRRTWHLASTIGRTRASTIGLRIAIGNVPFDVELLGVKGGVALPEP